MKKVLYLMVLLTLIAPGSLFAASASSVFTPELEERIQMLQKRIEDQEKAREKTNIKKAKIPVTKKAVPAVLKKVTTQKSDTISPTTPIKETIKEVIKDQTVVSPTDSTKPNIVQYNTDATKATTKASAVKANTTVQKSTSVLKSMGSAVWLSLEGAYDIIISWLK